MWRCHYNIIILAMLQVLLRQEHHDQSSRQTLCVQVRLPRADDRVPPEPAADASSAVRPPSIRWPIIGRRAVCSAVTVRIWWWPVRPAACFCFRPADPHISGRAVLLGHIRRGPFYAVPTSGRAAVSAVIQYFLIQYHDVYIQGMNFRTF